MSNISPSWIDSQYIYGTPSRHFDEALADNCLSLPRAAWGRANVELIQSENNYEARYRQAGCIRQTFINTMDFLIGNFNENTCLITLPALSLTTLAYVVTSIAATPFDVLGKCIKSCALEMNPTAKTYNQMAADHIQLLLDNDVTPEKIENLKEELKTPKSTLFLHQEIYALLLEETKCHPTDHINAKLEVQSTTHNLDLEIDLVIRPIVENNCIIDYDIAAPFNSISWLPTTRSDLSKSIQSQKNNLQNLEKEITAKETQLEVLRNAPRNFEKEVKKLLNPGLEEFHSLIQEGSL